MRKGLLANAKYTGTAILVPPWTVNLAPLVAGSQGSLPSEEPRAHDYPQSDAYYACFNFLGMSDIQSE